MASTSSSTGAPAEKPILKAFSAKRVKEGAGFIVRRPIGGPELSDEEADPFLLLDELGPVSYKPGEFPGAPWHPHRGFDTVMYLKQGEGSHRDSMGNSGTLRAGDCQWMTAASGIVHDEGKDHPGGPLHGFQMWVNLPAKHKMDPPAYQDVPAAKIPVIDAAPGVSAKIIAGECAGTKAVVQTLVPIQYIDFVVAEGASFEHAMPAEMETCMCWIYKGQGTFTSTKKGVKDGQMLVMGAGGSVCFEGGAGGLHFLLLAGKKLGEPIVRHGPFVMNTKQEIMQGRFWVQMGAMSEEPRDEHEQLQAFADYQNGTLTKQRAVMKDF